MSKQTSIIKPPAAQTGVRVDLLDWPAAQASASRIRLEVFVREQGVPAELEMDAHDGASLHALAVAGDGAAIGTGRLLRDGHIGRMAVLREWRHRRVGAALLDALIAAARQRGCPEAIVNAQTYVTAFYERAGFIVSSGVFDEAGIPHVEMRLALVQAGRSRPPG